ncbi:hypothetical protein [Spirillospora sp. NPDC029432]|uniref:hypothetical protein n=1 Tax=Spirillospora sp. NPDC029432 TaxID=3154599 RepID=UPI0034526103
MTPMTIRWAWRWCAVLLGAAPALLPGACSSGGARPTATPPATATSAATAPSTPTSPPGPLRLKQPFTLSNDPFPVTATAFAYRQPLPSRFPPDRSGYVFAGLDVRVCIEAGPGPVGVSWEPWSLTYADSTIAEPVSAWSDDWFSVPLFPGEGFGKSVRPGKCVRGWVIYEVRKSAPRAGGVRADRRRRRSDRKRAFLEAVNHAYHGALTPH